MQDEKNAPQDEDAEEVEGHAVRPAPDEGLRFRNEQDDDDEVEAHAARQSHASNPESHRQ